MQFKHPEILYFLFLLVIPILVHLFQLRRFKKEYFTNVEFLKEVVIQTRKSSTLKKWLLLCTRLLLLACIILAFAQPYFTAKDSTQTENELYIVLDNSYSMQAKGKNGELLKRAIHDLIVQTPENTKFSLLTSTENFWDTDIKSIQKELQELNYSALPFELETVVNQINSRKSIHNKDIVVITDGIGLKENAIKNFKKEDNIQFVIAQAEQKNNIAIDSVFMVQTLDNFYEIGVTIKAIGTQKNNTPIALYNNKKLIAKTQLELKNETKTINFTIPKEDFHGYATIEDNSLPYDNTYYFSISKPKKINVLSIGDTEKSTFLSKIYTNNEFNYKNYPLASLVYNEIENQDAIVLNELKDVPQALQTTLKSFVQKGGNLIIIPSIESSLNHLNQVVSQFGSLSYTSKIEEEQKVTSINFNHPLFSGVFEKKVDNFQFPSTRNRFNLKSNTSAILSYQDQSPFLTAVSSSVSNIYLFSAPINKRNSNFLNSPLVVLAFYNMAQNNQNNSVSSLIIGDNKPFITDAKIEKDGIISLKNDSESYIPLQQVLQNKIRLTFGDNPINAGNFTLTSNNQNIKNVSFNYNRTESDLEQNSFSLLENISVTNSLETVFTKFLVERTDTQIWKWFVILSIIFLALELLIQKFVK